MLHTVKMEEKSIEFLSKASKIIPPGTSSLRAHYLLKAKAIAEESDLRLPAKMFDDKYVCKFCGNLWSETKCLVRLVPKIMPGKKMRKILQRKEKNPQLLRTYELKLLKKCETDKDNKLVVICKVCNKKTCIPLTKPEEMKPPCEEEPVLITPIKSKKKRKSKDRFAGLNSSAVSSVSPNILNSSKKSTKKKIKRFTPTTDLSPYNTPKSTKVLNSISVTKTPFTPLIQKKMSVKKQVKVVKEQMEAEKKEQLKSSAKKAKRCNTLHKLLISEAVTPNAKTSLKDFLSTV